MVYQEVQKVKGLKPNLTISQNLAYGFFYASLILSNFDLKMPIVKISVKV
jgi:hypothetical protein